MSRRDRDDDPARPSTFDELTPVRATPAGELEDERDDYARPRRSTPSGRFAVGSDNHQSIERAGLDNAYFDVPPDDPRAPRMVDLADRVAAMEKMAPAIRRANRVTRFGVPTLSALVGIASAVLVWALARSDAAGDARATARAHQAEHSWLMITVRDHIVPGAARRDARLDALTDALRLYFPGAPRLHGPAPEPLPPVPTP